MKAKHLIKIIKEETNKALSEMVEPSDYLKKQFPDIIEYDREKKFSDLYWTVITIKKWDRNRIGDFQSAVGYSPMGYGGPYEVEENILPDNKFKYTWHCSATS